MKNQTITEISKQLMNNEYTDEEINLLKADQRVGVQKLLVKYEREQMKAEQQKQQFKEMSIFENKQYQQGKTYVAGIDEAGRGPLAGPVVAAAVILKPDFYLPGLNDSKQLSKQVRNQFYDMIVEESTSYGIGVIHSDEIDQLNIYQATKKAMKKAIQQLEPKPDHVLIDAVQLQDLLCTSEAITKGDQKSVSIAAASILAKVTRDNMMEEIHQNYPHYQFSSNMGYGTKEHIQAIHAYGVSPYHRHSFAPIKDIVEKK
ncbi:ribonuclease HII [Aquibacillus sediminis]|uniref:ribonuclease HII n=1 Tax=Aquibacillus sediminis TaxID=2574734 RepID=UPI001107FC70|nr:ribonuclease HII [Aquibacillus sediminis]